MSWPLASHFSAMLQSPRVAFRDPQLQRASIEKNEQNQPRPWAGQFAVVYKGIHADTQTPFAVRVFTTESPERHERYDAISAYLKDVNPSCLVHFGYYDRSIRSAGDGKWYPLILMDWVQGDTLFHWVRARALEGNGPALAALAERWVEAVNELAQARIAHGDLQHANIMVTPAGQIKFVDYDGMCVPALVGRRNLEVGVVPYQHPDRNEHTLLSLELDRFSSLMIYTALRALAVAPGLWQTYVEQSGYDKLLFRRDDFQNPGESALYRDLVGLDNAELTELVQQLFGLWQARMEQVPPLGQLVGAYRRIEQYLHEHRWEAAVELLNRRGHFRDAPPHLQPLIREAYENVCRNEAWLKFAQIPGEASEPVDRQLVQAWNESLFAGFAPAERERMRVAEARRRVRLIDRLCHLAQQIGGKVMLAGEKGLVAAATELPQGYKFSLRERVERARRCVTVYTRLERVLADPSSEAAIVAAWRSVVEARAEPLVSMDWGVRIALAEERAPVMRSLAEIPRDLPPAERDARLLALWREDLLADCREADRWRPYYQRALARKQTLPLVEAAVQRGDEVALVELASRQCLQGYPLPEPWTAAIETAKAHAAEAEKLLAALADGGGEAVRAMFQVAQIRGQAAKFAPYETQLAEAVRAELAANPHLGMQPPAEGPAVAAVDEPEGHQRVRWTWPDARWADRCLLAVLPEAPSDETDAENAPAHWRATLEQAAADGQLVPVERGWEGGHVVVWAVVDLGGTKITSRPLLLGQIEQRHRWSWKGLRRS
jgi:hypothetical protein